MNYHPETPNLIDDAIDIISDEHDWTQGADARDTDDNPVESNDCDACMWCAAGALSYAGDNYKPIVHDHARIVVAEAMTGVKELTPDNAVEAIVTFNDNSGTTHRAIIKSFAPTNPTRSNLSPNRRD